MEYGGCRSGLSGDEEGIRNGPDRLLQVTLNHEVRYPPVQAVQLGVLPIVVGLRPNGRMVGEADHLHDQPHLREGPVDHARPDRVLTGEGNPGFLRALGELAFQATGLVDFVGDGGRT